MEEALRLLHKYHIEFDVYEHPAVFTNEESDRLATNVPGHNAKNLFLTNDKKTAYYLLTLAHGKRADLKSFARAVGQKRLSFASAEAMEALLHLSPGSVSPLGLMYDTERKIQHWIDTDLLDSPKIFIHPNINTATVGISPEQLVSLLTDLGHQPQTFNAS